MQEVTAENAADYLRATGRVPASEPITVRELAGGVSNVVLLVEAPASRERFVLKQARPRLRVEQEWLCPVERIWREIDAIAIARRLIDFPELDEIIESMAPLVLWQDRENFLYAMAAAPPEHRTWKQALLAGELAAADEIAEECGFMLGQLHAQSWGEGRIAAQLDDRSYFEQLRLDPYYRHVARVYPELRGPLENLIVSISQNRRCFVHGDFSPKNLLVWPGFVLLIDFEVAHYGDPAFDLGFFLTHLVLKSMLAGTRREPYVALADRFWGTYQAVVQARIGDDEMQALEQRTLLHLAGCMLARVDGKSPVEYLTTENQANVRALARQWLIDPPRRLDQVLEKLNR